MLNTIQTVKEQGNGYLLNGNMSVPKADGNSEYELIKLWLAEGNEAEPEFTEAELEAKQLAEEKALAEQVKVTSLANLTVTTESGKVFYADTEARIDIESAIRVGELTSQDSTVWKLAEEFEGSKYAQVTIDELREASMLALLAKGSIVGAVQTQTEGAE